MGSRSRHVRVHVDRSALETYEFASDPRNLPRWASGLAGSGVEADGDVWFTESPMGRVSLRSPRSTTSVCRPEGQAVLTFHLWMVGSP